MIMPLRFSLGVSKERLLPSCIKVNACPNSSSGKAVMTSLLGFEEAVALMNLEVVLNCMTGFCSILLETLEGLADSFLIWKLSGTSRTYRKLKNTRKLNFATFFRVKPFSLSQKRKVITLRVYLIIWRKYKEKALLLHWKHGKIPNMLNICSNLPNLALMTH